MVAATTNTTRGKRWNEITQIWKDNRWLYLIAGLLLGILVMPAIEQIAGDIDNLLGNLVPEAVGIIFTILILDRLAENRAKEELQHRLIREASSQSNEIAKAAVDWLRNDGWLEGDASLLPGQNLRRANLKEAYLKQANLAGANLELAQLNSAHLSQANMEGANLERVLFNNANLRDANLKNTNLKGADFSGADLSGTQLEGADLSGAIVSEESLAKAQLDDSTNLEDIQVPSRFWTGRFGGNRGTDGSYIRQVAKRSSFGSQENQSGMSPVNPPQNSPSQTNVNTGGMRPINPPITTKDSATEEANPDSTTSPDNDEWISD